VDEARLVADEAGLVVDEAGLVAVEDARLVDVALEVLDVEPDTAATATVAAREVLDAEIVTVDDPRGIDAGEPPPMPQRFKTAFEPVLMSWALHDEPKHIPAVYAKFAVEQRQFMSVD